MEQRLPKINILNISVLVLGFLICYYLSIFINSLLGAGIIYVLMRPLVFYFNEKKKWNASLTAALMLLLSFMIFLLPIILISFLLVSKVSMLTNNYQFFLDAFQTQLVLLADKVGIKMDGFDMLSSAIPYLSNLAPSFMNSTATTVSQLLLMYFILYFMLKDNRKFEQWILHFTPFSPLKTQIILKEFKLNIHSNAIGIPLLGVVQGLVAWLGYAIFGVQDAYLWAILTGLFSVIPIVGTTLIWLPVCAYLFIAGNTPQAIGLLLYSVIIITNIDNVVRLLLQKKLADVHPLITVFGVILGIDLFGFIGIILGPLLISYFFILVEFYRKDKLETDQMQSVSSSI